MREVVIIGVGLHKFGRFPGLPYTELGRVAIVEALKDAGVEWKDIQSAYAGSAMQGMAAGQNVCAQVGKTGIPVVNTEQACGSGSGALRLAYHAVAGGIYDLVCAVGFEKLPRGTPAATDFPMWARLMGLAHYPGWDAQDIQRHMYEFGTTKEQFAKVAAISHNHGALNPYAHYQMRCTIEDVLNSRMIAEPLTMYMCAPADEGGAAAIVCAKEVAHKYSSRKPVNIASCIYVSNLYDNTKCEFLKGAYPETKLAGKLAYEEAGIGPEDVDVGQCTDSMVITMINAIEALGFCERGEGGPFVMSGKTELGGEIPFNTDGGYIARGNAFGATGLASIVETVKQLRGEAGPRQVPDAKVGLCQSLGAGVSDFVTILKR